MFSVIKRKERAQSPEKSTFKYYIQIQKHGFYPTLCVRFACHFIQRYPAKKMIKDTPSLVFYNESAFKTQYFET